MVRISVMKTQIELYSNLPRVTRATVKNALTDKGVRDRRLLFEITGILPTARPGPLCRDPGHQGAADGAKPEARPAESPRVLNQPWRRTLPGKVS